MKRIVVLILLGISAFSNAQQKLTFNYDSAGNQIVRELCLSGCDPLAKQTKELKEIEALADDELLKFEKADVLSYYPNPVKEELYIRWEMQENVYVRAIHVFSVAGHLVGSYEPSANANNQNIAFHNYSNGIYAVILYYNNGDQKSIKIIKK